jgi:hypothetical protein
MRLTTGSLLTCDTEARRLTYTLVPYGETSRPTSHGPVRIDRGTLELGAGHRVYLNDEHDPVRVLGIMTATTDSDAALTASFDVFPGPEGDKLLTAAHGGDKTGVSVEVESPVIHAGALLSGRLVGAAACVTPAFAGALLTASEVAEADAHDPATCPTCGQVRASDDTPPADPVPDTPEPTTLPADPDTEEEPMTGTDVIEPSAVVPASAPVLTASAQPRAITLHDAAAAIASTRGGDPVAAGLLTAVLSDITATSTGTAQGPDWLGEVWREDPRPRPFIDSVTQGQLKGIKPPSGWRWDLSPAVDDYAGDKGPVPSNSPTLLPVTGVLKRLAGAHDVDRAIFDLGETELVESYWAAMADSYAELSEAYFVTDILVAGATNGTAAAGVTVSSTAQEVIVATALQVIAGGGIPHFVGVAADLFSEYLSNPAIDALEFLTGNAGFDGTGSLGGMRIFLSPSLAAGTALGGDRRAARVHELSGSPIRAQAVNMPNGGIDVGVFGYLSGFLTKPSAVVKIIRPVV